MATYNMETSAGHFKAERRRSRRMIKVSGFLLILSFLLFLCQLINFGAFDAEASSVDNLPISIRAESQADYSQDPNAFDVPAISENILNQIIMDIPATGHPQDRMGTLQAVLSSPVPTMTPDSRLPVTPTLPHPTRTPIDTGTHTALAAATRYVSPTPTVTNTRAFVSNNSPLPTSTKTQRPATKTSTAPPTSTSTRTQTPTATPSQTLTISPSSSPTYTLMSTIALTATQTYTPTATLPPTSALTFTPSSTNTTTPTYTSTATETFTPTAILTHTPTVTPSQTPSPTQTHTATFTSTLAHTPSPTNTPTDTATATLTPSSTATQTATDTATPVPSDTPTLTTTSTDTPTFTPTSILSSTATQTFTPTHTPTDTPTATATHTPTSTTVPTDTPALTTTGTDTPTFTPTETPTLTPSSTPSPTNTLTPTLTNTPTDIPTPTYTPTETPTLTPTYTATSTATASQTYAPTLTATFTHTASATATQTFTPTATPTLTFTPTFTSTPTITYTPSQTSTPGSPACYVGTPNGLLPSDDSYIDGGSPSNNYGTDNTFEVRPDNGADRRGLVKFDLSSIPANANITSATLYLYSQDNKTGQTTSLYRVTSNWSESTVTWQSWTQPGGDFASGTSYFTFLPTQNNCMLTMDIASLVQAWVNGSYPNYGLMLYSTGPNHNIKYSSKDDGTASRQPKLDVAYTVPTHTPTQAPTGTPTSTYTPTSTPTPTHTPTHTMTFTPTPTATLSLPELSISDESSFENDTGSSTYQFVVSLSTVPSSTVSFDYSTTSGSGTGGSSCSGSTDFVNKSGTLSIVPPAIAVNINITFCGDGLAEPDEAFSVVLNNPVNAIINDSVGVGIIFDDDSPGFTSSDFVKNITPENGSLDASTNTTIVIEFNRDMCESTVLDPDNTRLYPLLLGSDVTASRAYNPLIRTLVITPLSNLSILTNYQVQVRNTQSTVDNCRLSPPPHNESFTTGL